MLQWQNSTYFLAPDILPGGLYRSIARNFTAKYRFEVYQGETYSRP